MTGKNAKPTENLTKEDHMKSISNEMSIIQNFSYFVLALSLQTLDVRLADSVKTVNFQNAVMQETIPRRKCEVMNL